MKKLISDLDTIITRTRKLNFKSSNRQDQEIFILVPVTSNLSAPMALTIEHASETSENRLLSAKLRDFDSLGLR